ncbi:MAG: HEAT repeat domain-containing protein [Anaerolineae bacterium]
MIDPYVNQLDSPDAERRKKAVIALGKSGDRAALPHLARVYKTDPNPEIRELALKAGRYLKRETEAQEIVPAEPQSLYAEPNKGEAASFLPPIVEVSERDENRAKELVEQALDWHVRGQDKKASDLLAKALAINPKLRRDAYTTSLAATITGMDGDEAMAMLATSGAPAARKEKPKRDDNVVDGVKEVGWGDALIDLALYSLVWAGGLTAIVLFALQGVQFLINASLFSGGSTALPAGTEELLDALPQLQLQLVIASIIFGLIMGIVLLVQTFIMHFSAVSILGGDGNLTTLIHGIVPTYIVTNILWIVIVVGYAIYVGVSSATASPSQIRDLNELGTNLNGIYQLGVGVWIAHLIGKVYRFGIFKGCAAEIISGILFIVLIFAFFCCAPSLLATLSSSAIR